MTKQGCRAQLIGGRDCHLYKQQRRLPLQIINYCDLWSKWTRLAVLVALVQAACWLKVFCKQLRLGEQLRTTHALVQALHSSAMLWEMAPPCHIPLFWVYTSVLGSPTHPLARCDSSEVVLIVDALLSTLKVSEKRFFACRFLLCVLTPTCRAGAFGDPMPTKDVGPCWPQIHYPP